MSQTPATSSAPTAAAEVSYRVSPLDDRLAAAHARLFPDYSDSISWKLANGGLIASASMAGEVVGVNAFMRSTFLRDAERVSGFQSLDTAVSEVARGRGLFTGLLSAFYRHPHGGALLYGFPNSASATGFFGKLGWTRLGTPPFLIKPLRAGYLLRKLGLSLDFPLSFARARGEPLRDFGEQAGALWAHFARGVGCAVDRSADYLVHRLAGRDYQSFGERSNGTLTGFVTTRVAAKHGGTIGYVMEALGDDLVPLLRGAVGHMRERGAEVALAWCFPWSPNHRAYLANGFLPLPERVRPIALHFGARSFDRRNKGLSARDWYLSYLDSDTV